MRPADLIDAIGLEDAMLLMKYLKWVSEVPRKPMPFTEEELERIQEAREILRSFPDE